jgi:DNA-binding response OmpR family regulator
VPARILVLDDEPVMRAFITRMLRDEAYEVVEGSDGNAARDGFREDGIRFDLIVTNTFVRGLSGEEVIRQLRVDFPGVPILHIENMQSARPSGDGPEVVPTLYTPFNIWTLRAAVKQLLEPN